MAFCTNCGKEITDGTKFCPNCGAQVGSGTTPDRASEMQNIRQQDMGAATNQQDMEAAGNQQNMYAAQPPVYEQQAPYVPSQPMPEAPKSGLDKFGKFYGIALLVLAIVDFNSDPPIVTILLSVLIIAGAVFCLRKKYKLKGFTIIALILAVICLFSGVGQSGKYGLFTIPKEYEHSSRSAIDNDSVSEQQNQETLSESKTETKDTQEAAASAKEEAAAEEPAQKETSEETAKDEAAKDQPSNESSSSEKAGSTGGVDPELKAFLDSYEDYIDEYVDFMKKYNSDPNNMLSMLGEYGDMMQKYADFAEALDQYDSDNMSAADYKYYIEVTTRCTQKMLEIY